MALPLRLVRPAADMQSENRKGFTGWIWVQSLAADLDRGSSSKTVHLDLSNLRYIGLYELVSCVALLERHIERNSNVRTIGLDFTGDHPELVVTQAELVRARKARGGRTGMLGELVAVGRVITEEMLAEARLWERLQGFVESMGIVRSIQAAPTKRARPIDVTFPFLGKSYGAPFQYATNWDTKPTEWHGVAPNASDDRSPPYTVMSGIWRVDGYEQCAELLRDANIQKWKNRIANQVPNCTNLPYLATNELWRTFFFEFALNIVEHAEMSGFLTGRIILPKTFACKRIGVWPRDADAALELCICDAGEGVTETLKDPFKDRFQRHGDERERMAFAFHDRGTRKKQQNRHLRTRHALARLKRLCEKYHGVLRIRTGREQFDFDFSGGGKPTEDPDVGTFPSGHCTATHHIHGTHVQLVLPIPPPSPVGRPNWLTVTLPEAFGVETRHPKGHLIPVAESLRDAGSCVSPEDYRRFREDCMALVDRYERLTRRPPQEPFVFDFSDTKNWTWLQLKVFFSNIQLLTERRPVLAVEVERELLREVRQSEQEGDIEPLVTNGGIPIAATGELLDPTSLVLVIARDRPDDSVILGMLGIDHVHQTALLSLCGSAVTVDKLLAEFPRTRRAVLDGVLGADNPLFEMPDRERGWQCVWSTAAILTESRRVVTRHFQSVALRNLAWRGAPSKYVNSERELLEHYSDNENDVFKLPWRPDEWVDAFLECGRIFVREREVDEIAQRLVHRLATFLECDPEGLSAVHMLAVTTAPALMLATGMHRWWNHEIRPCVVDLGHQLLQEPDKELPRIGEGRKVVVIQDVLDDGAVTLSILRRLAEQKAEVLCVLAFVRFVDDDTLDLVKELYGEGISPDEYPEDWCAIPPRSEWRTSWTTEESTPAHAILFVRRPASGAHLGDRAWERRHWVEPRSLRPYSYAQLLGSPPELLETWHSLVEGTQPNEKCFLRTGHFTYGTRHYGLTVDVREAFLAEFGRRLADDIADICLGKGGAPTGATPHGTGDEIWKRQVTFVLMPLHSQVHYLWQRVADSLASRGVRVPSLFLSATLFLGHGQSYRMPFQFEEQVRIALRRRREGMKEGGIRLLILDDALISGRTLETILAGIDRTLDHIRGATSDEVRDGIEWIRVYVVFNELPMARLRHWENLSHYGRRGIRFCISHHLHLPGLLNYHSGACPSCSRLSVIRRVRETGDLPVNGRLLDRWIDTLQPVAIDSGLDTLSIHAATTRKALPLGMGLAGENGTHFPQVKIWYFAQLMYRSYPISETLEECISLAEEEMPGHGLAENDVAARRLYRNAVYDWCFDNLARVRAMAAGGTLLSCLFTEMKLGSECAARLVLGMASHPDDPYVRYAVGWIMRRLAEVVHGHEGRLVAVTDAPELYALHSGIALFLEACRHAAGSLAVQLSPPGKVTNTRLIPWDQYASELCVDHPNAVPFFAPLCVATRGWPSPGDALRQLCEQMFRGRHPRNVLESSHLVLPRLARSYVQALPREDVAAPIGAMLQASLHVVIQTWDYLSHRCHLPLTDRALPRLRTILGDLQSSHRRLPGDFDFLFRVLEINGRYCKQLRETLHFPATQLHDRLAAEAETAGATICLVADEEPIDDLFLMGPFYDILNHVHNWSVLAAREHRADGCAEVGLSFSRAGGTVRIGIHNRCDVATAENRLMARPNFTHEQETLRQFAITVAVTPAASPATELGFQSSLSLIVPAGFFKRRT